MACCHISKIFFGGHGLPGMQLLVRLENFLVSGQDQLVMLQNGLVCALDVGTKDAEFGSCIRLGPPKFACGQLHQLRPWTTGSGA